MALVRDSAVTLIALEDTIFVTCSAILTTAGSTSPALTKLNATADAVVSAGAETTAFGVVIDRLGPSLGSVYNFAFPAGHFHASAGSTEANRQLTPGVKLQHGDSSGGGDMADYSTQNQPDNRTYFGTGRTSDMANWDASLSTGPLYIQSNSAGYDLRAAKRYVRVAVPVSKNRVTTESSGDEPARIGAAITFLAGNRLPEVLNPIYGTATAT